jgi:hypothetical protein
MIDRLIEIGICYGLEISMVKNWGKDISKAIISNTDCGISKPTEECFDYFCSMITTYANCTREIKSRIALKKQYSIKLGLCYHLSGLKFKKQTSGVLRVEIKLCVML